MSSKLDKLSCKISLVRLQPEDNMENIFNFQGHKLLDLQTSRVLDVSKHSEISG